MTRYKVKWWRWFRYHLYWPFCIQIFECLKYDKLLQRILLPLAVLGEIWALRRWKITLSEWMKLATDTQVSFYVFLMLLEFSQTEWTTDRSILKEQTNFKFSIKLSTSSCSYFSLVFCVTLSNSSQYRVLVWKAFPSIHVSVVQSRIAEFGNWKGSGINYKLKYK